MAKSEGFSQRQREEIVKQAISFWNSSTKVMEPLFEAINDYERLGRVLLPKELEDAYAEHPDRSALAPADIYNNISALRAQIHNFLFSTKPYAQLSIDGKPNLRDEGIIKAEQVLQSMLDMSDFSAESDYGIHQALLAGISGAVTQWVTKYERVAQRDEQYNLLTDKNNNVIFKMEAVAEYAETKCMDIRRIRIDPSAERKEQIRIFGYQSLVPLSDLLVLNRDPNSYYDFNELEVTNSSFDKDNYYKYISGEVDTYNGKGDINTDFADKMVEVYDVRGLFRTTDKDGRMTFRDMIVKIGNQTHLLAVKDNDLPIKGWDLLDLITVDKEHSRLYSMGLVEPAMDSYVEKFIKKNQSIDEANRKTYARYIADKSATQDLPDIIEHTPEQVLKVDLFASGAKSIHDIFAPIATDQSGQDTFNHALVLEDDIQKIMKLNDYRSAGDPKRKETATAVDALVGSGQVLLEKLVTNIKDSFLAPAWKKQLILYNFFMGHKENVIYNQQGQKIIVNKGELNQFYKVDIDIATSVDRPGMVRRFVEMYPTMIGDPYYDPYEVRKTAIEMQKLPNPEKLLPPNEHLQFIIDRENAPLGYGIQLPVSPYDPHQLHIEGHFAYRDFALAQGLKVDVLDEHIQAHQDELEKQSTALGNTKELGGNSGQMVNSEHASIKQSGGLTLKR